MTKSVRNIGRKIHIALLKSDTSSEKSQFSPSDTSSGGRRCKYTNGADAGFSHTHLFMDQYQIFRSISDLIIFTPPTSFFKADHNLVKLNDLNKENLYHCII